MLLKINPQTLLMIGSTKVTYDWFHIRYSYICAYVFMHVIYACYVCMLCMYMRFCSIWFAKHYLKLVPQTLLKTDSQVLL